MTKKTHRIELRGAGATGTVVNVAALQAVLRVVVDGSQQAVRLVAQGRSRARGALPRWIEKATEFELQICEGSTVVEISALTLREADPEEFSQDSLFPEIDPDLTSFDYLAEAFEAATGEGDRSDLYDQGLLETFSGLKPVFSHGIEEVQFKTSSDSPRRGPRITEADLGAFSELERRIPPPRRVITAAKLDSIRHSDSTFTLRTAPANDLIKGLATQSHLGKLQELWGEPVVVHGMAHFTATGRVQRIEAERIVGASEHDLSMWGGLPEPVTQPKAMSEYRVPQGPRSGVAAILGAWPGDEDEEEIREALEQLS